MPTDPSDPPPPSESGTPPTVGAAVTVRRADPRDAVEIAAILEEVGVTKLLAEPDPLTRQRLRAAIGAADDERHTVLVAEAHGAVIGFLAVHWTHNFRQGIDGFVSDLFVRADRRGRGGGTALVDAAKRRAAKVGCGRLVLFNGKNSEAYARSFYPKLGFREHDELACFILELPPEGPPG